MQACNELWAPLQGLPREDQRQLLLSVPFTHMSSILQALPGQACMDALLSIGAPLCKNLLLSMPSAASRKLLHAASLTDLAKLIKVTGTISYTGQSVFCLCVECPSEQLDCKCHLNKQAEEELLPMTMYTETVRLNLHGAKAMFHCGHSL